MEIAGPRISCQPGPQVTAAESTADVIFYGGAKGGGKSFWGLLESAKWFDLAGHSSLIFRRTYPELKGPGSLWDESLKIYPLIGGEPTESRLTWRFPAGSTITLTHLQHVKHAHAWNGKNIGDAFFDELPFFEEEQLWIIMSCQRAAVGGHAARPRIRATMNPDPDSWVLKFVEWYLDEAGFADPAKSGVIRWFGRVDGELRWYASEAEAKADGIRMPKSFTFIASKVWDNPALLEARPEYLANLEALPPVEQARYLGGNWKVRAQAGDYFQEVWFPMRRGPLEWRLLQQPTDDDIVRRFRVWDLAGTPWKGDTVDPETPARDTWDATGKRKKTTDPDWTRGGLFGLTRHGQLILLHMCGWRDSPGAIERAMIETHQMDGPTVECVVGHDPGQAGNYQIEALEKSLRRYGRVKRFHAVRATQGKEEYAKVASRMAHRGLIYVQAGDWNRALFSELEAFPSPRVHDDQVDVLSQAVAFALEHPGSLAGVDSPGGSRAQRTLNLNTRQIGDLLLP